MITPEDLAKTNTEEGHQKAFFCALTSHWHQYPELRWMHAIPNGGARDSITAGVLKATGVKAGVWDAFLPVAKDSWHVLYVEFKRPSRRAERNGGLSDSQKAFGLFVHGQGYKTCLVYTWQEAIKDTLLYLAKD